MYRASSAIIFVYDISNKYSFESIDRFIQQGVQYGEKTATLVLLGNKCDLESDRQITYEQGRKFAEKHSMMFFETSAKEGININEVFSQLAEVLKCNADEQVIPCNYRETMLQVQNQIYDENIGKSKCSI